MEKKIDISGLWSLQLDGQDEGQITLPGTLSEARIRPCREVPTTDHLTDPYAYTGEAVYTRTVSLPETDGYLLTLERTRISTVWVNGSRVGTQDSFIAPHRYDLTGMAHAGENELRISIKNTGYKVPGGHMTSPDTQTNWNGIVGELSITCQDEIRIDGLKSEMLRKPLMQEGDMVQAQTPVYGAGLRITLTNLTDASFPVRLTVRSSLLQLRRECFDWDFDPDPGSFEDYLSVNEDIEKPESREFTLVSGVNHILLDYDLTSSSRLWDEFSPAVYRLTVTASHPEGASVGEAWPLCEASTLFGLKAFSHDGEHFTINGRTTFLRGKHDGMSFPLTGYAPMTPEVWLRLFLTARKYGINHYRYHTCCPPEAAFIAADLVGIYLQPELSFWGTFNGPEDEGYDAVAQDFLQAEGYRILSEYGNHPSFCMMSMGNELWGNAAALDGLVAAYKTERPQILFTQGSNNFFWTPVIGAHDDFFSGVRFSIDRQIRGSFAACDIPYGHVQAAAPGTQFSYDPAIRPQEASGSLFSKEEQETAQSQERIPEGYADIQYGTGVKRVKLSELDKELIPGVPVISHEVGQYQFYPDFKEISSYTGVLTPENLKLYRERLAKAGLLPMAEKFFRAAGNLAVACYRDELETLLRSSHLAGFQLLDLTDFPGQGTALVGILNAFYENKGLISAGGWRCFCSDAVLQAEFPTYILRSGESFDFTASIRYERKELLGDALLTVTLAESRSACQSAEGTSCEDCASGHGERGDGSCTSVTSYSRARKISINERGYQTLGSFSFELPPHTEPGSYTLTLSIKGTDIHNSYTLWYYPSEVTLADLPIAETREEAEELAKTHRYSLLLLSDRENPDSIEGFYASDFWNFKMFKSISENVGKPIAPGTLGLYIQNDHPALAGFPCRSYTTPQWYDIITHSRSTILDGTGIEPIIWTIDNVERNHRLGLLYELPARTEGSTILVCTSDLATLLAEGSPTALQLLKSLTDYVKKRNS